ncbi:MAG: proton-conducting transporter membrane subunit [Planctomycetota bacterium]
MDTTAQTYMVLIPALPLMGAILTAVLGPRLLKQYSHLPIIIALMLSTICSAALLRQVSLANERQEVADEAAGQRYAGFEHTYTLWTWADIAKAYQPAQVPADGLSEHPRSESADFRVDVVLRTDGLTSIMLVMVTFIATLVAIFGAGYMHGDRGFWRFFTYIGLFVFSMTMLVSVSNFVLLFVFWEAVGVCSYLLIGFWYTKPEAAAAGQKAFLVNRVGDFGFALALFLIWTTYGTLDFHDTPSATSTATATGTHDHAAADFDLPFDSSLMASNHPLGSNDAGFVAALSSSPAKATKTLKASEFTGHVGVLGRERLRTNDYIGGTIGLAICLLLMLGACGKSAQFPLHVWLPDAMEGPTPVSALIHAATMVTAGIYMVTRCTPLFMVSPTAQVTVSVVGAITALMAALIALTQYDLKRVLAYSTVSQLGLMFVGLGTGTLAGITAGMFHLFTHAFFKALLFLGAGSVMHAMGNIIDMRRFSGLRKLMPITYVTGFVGCLALAGVPPLSGFWSKDAVFAAVHDKAHELTASGEHVPYAEVYQVLYYVALVIAMLTAFYTFRAFFMTFFGDLKVPREAGHHAHESPPGMTWPLVILAVFAAFVGLYLELTHGFAHHVHQTPSLAAGAVASTAAGGGFHLSVAATSTLVAVGGILLAAYLYLGDRREISIIDSMMKLQLNPRQAIPLVDQRVRQVTSLVARLKQGLQQSGLGWIWSILAILGGAVSLLASIPLLILQTMPPQRLSYRKFYWDEIYQVAIVWPLQGLARLCYWIDRWLVDGVVNLLGRIPVLAGSLLRSLQVGLVPVYGLAMVIGTLVLLAAQWLWAGR